MGNVAGNMVEAQATSIKESAVSASKTQMDSLSPNKKPEDPLDSVIEKVVSVGQGIWYTGETKVREAERQRVIDKNKKQSNAIREKYGIK